MNKQLEKRSFELRVQNSDSRLITGKAICFDSMSEDLGFREIISKVSYYILGLLGN